MKKKSILLLLVTLILSFVFGLVGCDGEFVESGNGDNGNGNGNGNNGNGNGQQVVISEEEKTKFALIVESNSASGILAENTNYEIAYEFTDGEIKGYTAKYVYVNEEGKYSADYLLKDDEANVVAATNIREGVSYSIDVNGDATYGIYSSENYNDQAFSIGAIDFSEQSLSANLKEANGVLTFATTSAKEGVEAKFTTTYDFEVDATTLLYKKLTKTVVDAEGNVTEKAVITFGYDVEGYEANLIAYETITDEEAEKVTLTALFNPETENYTWEYEKSWTVAKGTDIVFEVATDGTSYSFYENVSCTKNIESTKEYLDYYGDVTVYATQTKAEISFKFTLTEADVENMESLIELFLQYVEEGYSFDDIDLIRSYFEDKMGYFVHMYYVGQIEYYKDITNEEGKEKMTFAQSTYNDMYEAYIDAYRAVYEKDEGHPYREYLFEGWTEEDFKIFEKDNAAISALEEANSEIETQFNELRDNDAEWSFKVEQLYEQLVANNQQIAALNGYDNAYDYYADSVYDRRYTAEEREVLVSSIKKYIVTYYNTSMDNWNQLRGTLSNNDITKYNAAMNNGLKSLDNEYIGGYINSFNNSLKQKMANMYEKKAYVFATSADSQSTAYANYSGYYGEAFTYFGKDRTELMTIIHEMGHYISFSSYSLSDMGYDLAETHSQGNEWLMLYYLKDNMARKTYNITKTLRMVNGFYSIMHAMIVDEFEYRVYTAETPYVAGEFRNVMIDVLAYFGMMESELETYYDNYAQIVTITSPVYYLNYATSEIAAMGFYAIADQQGYDVAQEVYRRLQEDCDLTKTYGEILKEIGLSSPFEEQTYVDIGNAFDLVEE